MSQNISFKQKLKKVSQEQTYSTNHPSRYNRQKQNNQISAKNDPYGYFTKKIQQSHQYQKGDFKTLYSNHPDSRQIDRIPVPNISRRIPKNNSYCQIQCDEQLQTPSGLLSRTNTNGIQYNQQISLMSSNANQNIETIQSKLVDRIQKLESKIDMEHNFIEQFIDRKFKKMLQKVKQCKNQYTGGFNQIVNQLNVSIQSMRKKNKHALNLGQQNAQKTQELSKKFIDSMNQIQEKFQKILNSQTSLSMKKSINQNPCNMSYAADYAVDLKNSMKQMSIQNNSQPIDHHLYEQLKAQMNNLEQGLKNIKYQVFDINTKIDTIKYQNDQNLKVKQEINEPKQCSDLCVKFQEETLKTIRKVEKDFSEILAKQTTGLSQKFKEFKQILQIQQENIKGINDQFTKVTNQLIMPKIRKIQESKIQNDQLLTTIQSEIKTISTKTPSIHTLKSEIFADIPTTKIFRTKGCDDSLKNKIQKSKIQLNNELQTYLVDQDNHLMDCYGNYLTDQQHLRLKLSDSEMYYLLTIQNMPIRSL